MYIVDQDRSNVVNIGNIKSIALNGKRITADDYTLAAYDTEQRGKILTIFEAGSDNMGEIIKDRMAVGIGRALKENGAIQFETYDDPMKCGIIVDAKVKIVMP